MQYCSGLKQETPTLLCNPTRRPKYLFNLSEGSSDLIINIYKQDSIGLLSLQLKQNIVHKVIKLRVSFPDLIVMVITDMAVVISFIFALRL